MAFQRLEAGTPIELHLWHIPYPAGPLLLEAFSDYAARWIEYERRCVYLKWVVLDDPLVGLEKSTGITDQVE